jgi:AraC-like DNA-binding protein
MGFPDGDRGERGDGRLKLLPSAVFSTDETPPEGRFETWREFFSSVHEVVLPKRAEATFSARGEYWGLGPVLLGANTTPRRRVVRPESRRSRDAFDAWVLQVNRDGPMGGLYAGGETRTEAGRLFVGNLAESYDLDRPGGFWVGAVISREVVAGWGVDLEALGTTTPRGPGAALLADFLLSLARRLPEAPAPAEAALADAVRAMVVACLVHDAAPKRVAPEDAARRKRAEAERVIRREIASARLDAERIARLSGVSRSTLYRLFEHDGGVAGYVQRLRLAHARAALADPASRGAPIGALAERAGFHCAASFTRAFRRAYGETPSDFRGRAAGGASTPRRPNFEAMLRAG